MFASLAALGAYVVENPPTTGFGTFEGRHGYECSAALGTAEDATGELPQASPGQRAFLIVPESIVCAFHILFGSASVGNWDGDPLLARLLGVAPTGDVASLATRFLIEYARALRIASVVPPDAVGPLLVEALGARWIVDWKVASSEEVSEASGMAPATRPLTFRGSWRYS